MKKFIIASLLFLIYLPAFAHTVNPHLAGMTIKKEKINLAYEDYYRQTIFFHGYKGKVHFKNYLLGYTHRTASGVDYNLNLGLGEADLDGRKTAEYGYDIRLGLSMDICGDLAVLPMWKWYIDVSKGDYKFRDYLNQKISIDYGFTSINLALFCAKRYGPLVPYGGVMFFYLMDRYSENTKNLSMSSDTSGLSPFIGIRLQMLNRMFIRWEMEFIDEKGFSGNLEFEI